MEPFENTNEEKYTDFDLPDSSAEDPSFHPNGFHTDEDPAPQEKASPYANSPYVIQHQPDGQYHSTRKPTPPAPPKKPRSGHSRLRGIAACALTLALVAGGCLITAQSVNRTWEARVQSLTQRVEQLESQQQNTASSSQTLIPQQLPSDGSAMAPRQLYAYSVNSVVAISTTAETNTFYGSGKSTGAGSGFILTADGYVVTNYHVVENAQSIKVILHDGTEYTAAVKGHDSTNDIAVLKIDATDLPAAAIGKSSDLAIGDMVVAIGNPLGKLAATQTVGYVSGINREVATDNSIINMIQTDAAINPGNSGGPLFNMQGQVIGITTAKYSGSTSSGASIEGIGFAIPIDDVMPAISDLIDRGYVSGAYLGIVVQNTDAASAAMFGLPTGAYVVETTPGGSADRAGILEKDIIIRLGDTKISNLTDLTRALRTFKAGDTTTITVIRSGQERTMDITLDERPQPTETTPAPLPDAQMPSEGNYEDWYNWFFNRGIPGK